jgi:hypothetical protein
MATQATPDLSISIPDAAPPVAIVPIALPPQQPTPPALAIPDSPEITKYAVKSAVRLAIFCIVGALILCLVLMVRGLHSTDVVLIRVLLSCVAVFVAAGFVAIGFSLFLIKADGALKATFATGTNASSLDTSAPGLAVVACAVVVMYLALHMKFSAADPVDDQPAFATKSISDATTSSDAGPLGGTAEVLK